ncbi:hypothetical protein DV737_g1492, partial [Chaetothyriales sp. CBS 132003]
MSTPYASGPFDTRVFFTLPQLEDDSKSTLIWRGFHLDDRLESETFSLADVKEERLPKLEGGLFEFKFDEDTALTPVDASSVSDSATADEDGQEKRPNEPETTSEAIEDVWILPEVTFPTKTPILPSWDRFLNDQYEEPAPAYLSEANPKIFDAVIQVTCKLPVKRVKPDTFLNALYELALGRNSAIFVWDEQTCTFKQNSVTFTVSGFTPGTIQAVVEEFKMGAELFRRIQRYQPDASGRADIIAFHAVLRSCILSIEAYMELQKTSISSVLNNSGSILTVPLNEVLDLSLSPFIFAQHRLLSNSVLSALFSTHRFSSHLHLLRQIHLFGDGIFTARLSMALFGDDELQGSGEGGDRSTAGPSITTGLRLQTRDSWPPASSELRLVLMGILSDSVRSAARGIVRELEDTTSFAIRDLSDDELDACRDINSIHALDFLKLQYKAPNPLLEAVVTADSLGKYDGIFKHLLRVLRLKSHFMTSLADYCANVAIGLPWARLQQAVRSIESRLGKADHDGTARQLGGGGGQGLAFLRHVHARTLNEMLGALLLRKQSEAAAEAEAMRTLETLFNLVLAYAAFATAQRQRRRSATLCGGLWR